MQSVTTIKKWGELTADEESQKLLKLNELVIKHGLERIEIVSADHVVYMLKSNINLA